MRSPDTATAISLSGSRAGPWITSPVAASYIEPWQGQWNSVPAAATTHCWCVQIGAERDHLPGGGLRDERGFAVDRGVDAAAHGDVGERGDVVADGGRIGGGTRLDRGFLGHVGRRARGVVIARETSAAQPASTSAPPNAPSDPNGEHGHAA